MSLAKEIPVVRWMRMCQSCITGDKSWVRRFCRLFSHLVRGAKFMWHRLVDLVNS